MRTFDAVICGARRKSGKRKIARRGREGEILFRAIAASALVRRTREKKSRTVRRYRSQRSTCDLERDRVHPPRASRGRNPPLVITWWLGGGFHGPRLSRSADRTKRACSSSTNRK